MILNKGTVEVISSAHRSDDGEDGTSKDVEDDTSETDEAYYDDGKDVLGEDEDDYAFEDIIEEEDESDFPVVEALYLEAAVDDIAARRR